MVWWSCDVAGQHRGLWFHTIGQRKGIVYVKLAIFTGHSPVFFIVYPLSIMCYSIPLTFF